MAGGSPPKGVPLSRAHPGMTFCSDDHFHRFGCDDPGDWPLGEKGAGLCNTVHEIADLKKWSMIKGHD